MSAQILVEKIGHVALLTMSNPPANTWTPESLQQLKSIVLELNEDKDNYALVLIGEGEKFFSAGADLNLFADGDKGNANGMARCFGEAFETLTDYRGVSIAAINGWSMGGGLEVALCCDIRIAAENAKMALPEASVGLLPCAGGTQNLPWLVGEGWAKRMILCGERVDAETAFKIGLVEEVTPADKIKETALALAEKVQNQSPTSVAACKELIQAARWNPLRQVLPTEREKFVDLFDSEDQREGVNAFLEKRKPEWKNQ